MSDSFVTPWTVAHWVPLFMGFSRQEYWTGLPCPPPGDLRNLGMEAVSPALQAVSSTLEPPGKPSMECYPVIKRNELSSHEKTQKNLKYI